MEFAVSSCIRGYHVYSTVWMAILGELLCEREPGNVVDRYAVAAKKPALGVIVGQLLNKISRRCSIFILCVGAIKATVTGICRYSSDLAHSGLEIPCKLKFWGKSENCRELGATEIIYSICSTN